MKLEIVLVDRFDDLLPGLVAGRYDVVMSGLTRTLERARTVAFSDPYFASGLQVLAPSSTTLHHAGALAAAHARVAVRAGTTAESFARATLAGAAVARAAHRRRACSPPSIAASADAAVIDYVTRARRRGARPAARAACRRSKIAASPSSTSPSPCARATPTGSAWLNLLLREAKASGEFHALAARYNPWFRSER